MKGDANSNVSLGQVAYEAIREAIVRGDIKPGQRISEYTVAKWLDVSRTPAREGLRRLQSEGLLASHPVRGLVVASLDDSALDELYSVRATLEAEAAFLAARHATKSERDTLKNLVEAEAEIVDDPRRMYEHNKVFHQLIYRAARNRYLLQFLNAISDVINVQASVSSIMDPKRRQAVLLEHKAIVTAIAKRQDNAARLAAMAHIKATHAARVPLKQGSILSGRKRRAT